MSHLSDLVRSAKDTYIGAVKRFDAKGRTVYSTKPAGKSANLDIAKMAQDQADRVLGKKHESPLTSTMTPVKKAGK